jgi:uncharacterized membrane protein
MVPIILVIFYGFLLRPIFSIVYASLTNGLYSLTGAPLLSFEAMIIPILTLVVIALVGFIIGIFAIHRLSQYYTEPAIFRNAILALIVSLVGIGLTIAVISSIVLSAETSAKIVGGITTIAPMTGTMATLLVSALFTAFVLELAGAVFYMLVFHKLGNKSGVYNFNKAGTLYLIGIVMAIVIIGGVIIWIAWIYSASGFNSLKPKAAEAPNLPNSISNLTKKHLIFKPLITKQRQL